MAKRNTYAAELAKPIYRSKVVPNKKKQVAKFDKRGEYD